MTQPSKTLRRTRRSDHQFLFYRTDKIITDQESRGFSKDIEATLTGAFPAMLVGQAFLEQAMTALDGVQESGAIVIRIEAPEPSDEETLSGLMVNVAQTIGESCNHKNGIWGRIEGDVFACIFPEITGEKLENLAQTMLQKIEKSRNGTVTIGMASFPTLDFPKDRILDNARKALDHATFFGPGNWVSFDAVSLNISGDQFYQEGDIKAAVDEFQRALALDPSNINVHNSLGVCWGVMGDFDKAIAEFESAAALDTKEPMALYNLGMAHLLANNDKNKALELFLKAGEVGNGVFEIHLQTGKLYLEMGQHEKALVYCEAAVHLKPDSGLANRYLGDCQAAMGRSEAAVAAYKTAVKHSPNDSEALSALGCLLDEMGENPEVTIAFCQHSVEIAPDNGRFRYRLGSLYQKQGRLDDALHQFNRAKELGYDAQGVIDEIVRMIKEN